MALATSTLRSAWAPACRDGHALLPMYVGIDAALKKWRYEPHEGTGAANCRPITGGTGNSLHAYFGEAPFTFWNGYRIPLMALAVDINPQQNPYGPRLVTDMPRGMIDDITRIRTKSGDQMIGWGGYFTGNRDAMHFQGVCTPSAMATGIDPKSLPQLPQTPPIAAPEALVYKIVWIKASGKPGAAYRVLFAKGKDGKDFPAMAFDIDSGDLDGWRKRLEEVPSSKPLPPSPYIRIVDGPYANV